MVTDDKTITDRPQNTTPLDTDALVLEFDPGGSPATQYSLVEDVLRIAAGEISVTAGVGTQSPAATTFTKVTQFTAQNSRKNVVADFADDSIILTAAATYEAYWMVSFVPGAAALEVRLAIYWNGAIVGVPLILTTQDTSVHGALVQVPVPAIAASQKLEAFVWLGSSTTFDVTESVLAVRRVP